MNLFSFFRRKKNRITFEYAPDLSNYRTFPEQPPEVRSVYRFCKISMALYIPLFSVIAFFNLMIAITGVLLVWLFTFNRTCCKYGLKAAFVPLICSVTGILFGVIFARCLIPFQEVP
jgi:hypothetical protein